MFVVFYTVNSCMYIYDLSHILLSLWHTYRSMVCTYGWMYVCMYGVEGGGKSKYCTIGNFLSWTFMGTKWGRHCRDLTQVIIELLVCMEQLTEFLITEPRDLYGHYKSW